MKLIRAVIATFDPDPKQPESWELRVGRVSMNTSRLNVDRGGFWKVLLTASIDIERPTLTTDGYIPIPEDERREMEFAIESICNVVSVVGRCRRMISSATPSIAMIPSSQEERDLLEASNGFEGSSVSVAAFTSRDQLSIELLEYLRDRPSGVALMAEAQGHSLATGRFHEFVRLFEAAFALPFSQLHKKLRATLNPAYGYSKDEIDHWKSLRDPLTHADGKKADVILLDSDVRRDIPRIEQAAFDILFNKLSWGDRSNARRNVWAPNAATTSRDGAGIIRQGSAPTFVFQVFDEFGVFPRDLNGILTPPPKDWWFKFNQDAVKVEGTVNVES